MCMCSNKGTASDDIGSGGAREESQPPSRSIVSSSSSASGSIVLTSGAVEKPSRKSLAPSRRQGPSVVAGSNAGVHTDPRHGVSAWTVQLAAMTSVFRKNAAEEGAVEHEDPDGGLFANSMLAPAMKCKGRLDHDSALESLRATKRACTINVCGNGEPSHGSGEGTFSEQADFGTDLYHAVHTSSGTSTTLSNIAVLLQIIVKRLEVLEVTCLYTLL